MNIKKIILISLILIITIFSLTVLSAGGDNAREIMEKRYKLPSFEKMKGEQSMKIYGSDGDLLYNKKSRMASYIENMGDKENEVTKTIVYFYSPSEDKGNSSLSINYKDESKEDLLLVYLKGLKKPKRIASSGEKKSSYMGSDFTNNDIANESNIDDYEYVMIDDTAIVEFKGKKLKCYQIESRPVNDSVKDETGYGKIVTWLEKSSLLVFKTEFYDENNEKLKLMTLQGFTTKKNINGDKVRFPISFTMENLQKGTKTEIQFEELFVEENSNIRTDIFTEQYLTKKWW
jgi:hypothetical protein